MHNIRTIRANPRDFDENLLRRNHEASSENILALDNKRRAKILQSEKAQAEKNVISEKVRKAKLDNDAKMFEELRILLNTTKAGIAQLDQEAKEASEKLQKYLLSLPNLPSHDTPTGKDETDNCEVDRWGTPREFKFQPKEHFLIRGAKGLNFKDAAKISGSRFVILEGAMATLQRALTQFMLDTQINKHGLNEVWTPVIVNERCMMGTGQLPKFSEDSYSISDTQWLIPTSEVSLTNIFSEKILSSDDLPKRLVCHSQCFRSEAGSAGRDTTGMLRQHQFEKVEMVSITNPNESDYELKRMVSCAQSILQLLEIPYRTMLLCAGDIGFSATKTYDIEVWLPGQGRYREISSCSCCSDFQARRMNARFRPSANSKPEYVHTLNGSGLAIGRCLIAVLENYQEEDGSIVIPSVLRPYLKNATVITDTGELI